MTSEDEWLAWRRAGVTATEVADAMAGTYGGAYGVVARKRGLVTVEQTPQMARGHRWQPVIAAATHILTGLHVVGEETWIQSASDPRWRATVDGFLALTDEASLADCLGVFEAKTTGYGARPNRSRWYHQIQWQMLVSGQPMALLAEAVIDDAVDQCREVRLSYHEADSLAQRDLIERAEEIWRHMQEGTLPEPEVASALEVARQVYAVANGDEPPRDLDAIADDVMRYKALGDEVADLQELRGAIEARIVDAMGEATKGTSSGYRISLSLPARKLTAEREADLLAEHPEYGKVTLDRSLVKAEAPDLYEAFQSRDGARRLTVTAPRDS